MEELELLMGALSGGNSRRQQVKMSKIKIGPKIKTGLAEPSRKRFFFLSVVMGGGILFLRISLGELSVKCVA